MRPRTLAQKIWDQHVVAALAPDEDLLYIDRVFLHERTGPQVLEALQAAGRGPRGEWVFGVMDHSVETAPGRGLHSLAGPGARFIPPFRQLTAQAGIPLFDIDHPSQGIVHVMAPELGLALPGCTLVCPDSHTCTVGGIGALAWGIGSTEGEHAVATHTLARRRPQQMRVRFTGTLGAGVTAKDMALALIARHGTEGGAGRAVEFGGPVVQSLDVEARMTLCNMAAEFGAWTGIVAPDARTVAWLRERVPLPQAALDHWASLRSDDDADWDSEIEFDVTGVEPQVTWGTSPEHAVGIAQAVPDAAAHGDAARQAAWAKALAYMGLQAGAPLRGVPIDAAFIGSCTNSRLSDLRLAAEVVRGRKVAPGLRALIVPGSMQVRAAAQAEGLDRVFLDAGFEWRASGCSMCTSSSADSLGDARRVISSTNRNYEGRQGPGVRTHLASPATVAASAIAGCIADPRDFLGPV